MMFLILPELEQSRHASHKMPMSCGLLVLVLADGEHKLCEKLRKMSSREQTLQRTKRPSFSGCV